ncbi:ABC transporter permease [Solimonas variicoloris]|uniref:ABC transporter permease n=1 Tax=Solimonas variicoloris TaxID=254408 RepID=UPI00035FD74A|nr:FtsX-like permease family protein [Solimonas variicoloris]
MDFMPIIAALKRQKTAAALIAIEIALCCAIICNALFLIIHRLERSSIPSGVPENELVRIQTTSVAEDPDVDARARAALQSLREIPGVQGATLINQVPFGRSSWNSGLRLKPEDKNTIVNATIYYGDAAMLSTLGAKLVAGRWFEESEFGDFATLLGAPDGEQPKIVIITRQLGQKLFGNENPLGREFAFGDVPVRVIGVLEHLVRPSIFDDATADCSLVFPVRMGAGYGAQYVLRTRPQDRDAVIAAAKKKLAEAMPNRIVLDTKGFDELRDENFKQDRVMAGLLIAVVVSLLVVTALGIVGLASFWVQRRRRQIGIRRALGATRGQILRYFQTENFLIVTVGIAVGMAAAFGISGWLMHHYELPRLPLYYLPVGAVALWLLGQIAVLAPALRAASVPPATATRPA